MLISLLLSSSDTSSRHSTRSSGNPSLASSLRNRSTTTLQTLIPRGCGPKMIELRVFNAAAALPIGVTTGFVDGRTAHTTPTGFAISSILFSSILRITPTDFFPFKLSQIRADLLRHFAILSFTSPIRDSSAAILPSIS